MTTNRGRRVATAIASVFLVATTMLACQSQPAAPTQAPPAQATQAPAAPATQPAALATQPAAPPATAVATVVAETVKVGFSAPLTGPYARAGTIAEKFTRMAIDDINAKGGVKVGGKTYRLEAVSVDDKVTSEGGREAANRLVLAEKVKFWFISGGSSVLAGAQPLTEPNRVVVFSVGAADQSLGPNFPYTLVSGQAHQRMRIAALYQWLANDQPLAKRVALVHQDDPSGRQIAPQAEEHAKNLGLTIVAKEYYPGDTKDFNPLVTRVLRQTPDAIDIGPMGAAVPTFIAFTKALWDQGYRKTIFTVSGSAAGVRQAGETAKNLIFGTLADYNVAAVPQAEKEVIQRYVQKYGESELELNSEPVYASPVVLAQAMEKAGTVDDTEKIVKTLRDGEWDTMWGKMRFSGAKTYGIPQLLETLVYLSKVEGDKLVTFRALKGTIP